MFFYISYDLFSRGSSLWSFRSRFFINPGKLANLVLSCMGKIMKKLLLLNFDGNDHNSEKVYIK